MTTSVRTIATPHGDARLHADRSRHPHVALVLGHGAGRGVDSPDLLALAAALPGVGISVFRIEQPWRVAGRKVAGRPHLLDEATAVCVNAIRFRTPFVLGGRSAGARVACRLARELGAVGCLALSFPLHPPGKSAESRRSELMHSAVPTFIVQGERDAFGGPDEFPATTDLTLIPDADHGFGVPKRAPLSAEQTMALIVEAVVEWMTSRIG